MYSGKLQLQRNINECILLVSLLTQSKLKLSPETIPNLSRIGFRELKDYSMDRKTFNILIRYLHQKENNSEEDIKEFLYQCEFIISSMFNSRAVDFVTTVRIMELATLARNTNRNLYDKIVRCIVEIITKYPNFVIEHG
jgi:hypothetical protein